MMKESLNAAAEVIDALRAKGLDYGAHHDTIALQLFDEGLFQGNWDSRTDLQDPTLPDLRAINEDEYDQHMDHSEDKPHLNDKLCYSVSACAYIWKA